MEFMVNASQPGKVRAPRPLDDDNTDSMKRQQQFRLNVRSLSARAKSASSYESRAAALDHAAHCLASGWLSSRKSQEDGETPRRFV